YAGIDWQRIDVIGGGLQSQSIGVTPIELVNRTGDVLFVRSNIEKEVLDVPFEISPGIAIPAGSCSFSDIGVEIRGSGFRKLSGRIAYIDGDFYGGTRDHNLQDFDRDNRFHSQFSDATVKVNTRFDSEVGPLRAAGRAS